MAVIVVMLVMMVVSSLAIAGVQIAAHAVQTGAYDRKHDQALQAAEAGLDAYIASAQGNLTLANICPYPATSGWTSLSTTPVVRYRTTVTVYDSTGGVINCATYAGSPAPNSITVVGEGNAGTQTASGVSVTRKVESKIITTPITNPALNYAMYAENNLINHSNGTVYHNVTAYDADIYVRGDYTGDVASFNQEGSLLVRGSILDFRGHIYGNVYALGSITGQSATVGSPTSDTGYGKVTAATGSVALSSSTNAEGKCQAGTTVTLNSASVCNNHTGATAPNTIPSTPISDPAAQDALVPDWGFPLYKWPLHDNTAAGGLATKSCWQSVVCNGVANFTIRTIPTNFADCDAARTYILSAPVGNNLVDIGNADCALSFGNLTSVQLRGNLAIITDGSWSSSQNENWNSCTTGACPTPPAGGWNFWLIHPNPETGLNCATNADNFAFDNNNDWSNLQLFIYTPCKADVSNKSGITGQVIARDITTGNNGTLNFKKIPTPGFAPAGFDAQVVYVREIQV